MLIPAFPQPIETERLILRSPQPGDGAELNAAIRETFVELHQWMDWASSMPTLEHDEERCQSVHKQFLAGEDFPIHVYLKSSNALVACSGLHPGDWSDQKFEIGYWCRLGYQGNGYITETVNALTRVGFKVFKAKRIEIRCDERNIRSRRVAELCGYSLEAKLGNHQVAPDGILRNTLVFAMLPEDYAKRETNN